MLSPFPTHSSRGVDADSCPDNSPGISGPDSRIGYSIGTARFSRQLFFASFLQVLFFCKYLGSPLPSSGAGLRVRAGALQLGMQRRQFMRAAAGLAGAALAQDRSQGQGSARKMVGIQMEVAPIHDRGAGKVLDDIQRRAHVNTIFLGVFTYTDTRAGVQKPNFHGGNFAVVHPQYYKDTP